MTTMSAVRWHASGDVRLDTIAVRAPGPDEVLVRTAYVGVCGSDLHEVVDGPHAIPDKIPHGLSGSTAPLVLGHEFSGVVHAVGSAVTHVRPGDLVAVEPNYRCGACVSCRRGRYHTCEHFGFAGLMGDGGMAEYSTLPAYMLHRLPPGFDLAQAAVLEPAAVALHAVRRSGLGPGDSAVVVGLGPVGLLVCILLRIKGVRRVLGIERLATRRALAERLGVDVVVDPCSLDKPGVMALRQEADAAFEVAGSQATFERALDLVRPGGTVVLLGLARQLQFDGMHLVNNEITVRASVGYNDCHPELIDLVSSGQLDLSSFTRDVVSLDEAAGALCDLAAGRRHSLKTLVRVT